MSFREVGWVLNHSPYAAAQRVIHIVLAERANEDRDWELWYSVAIVARKANTSRRTVERCFSRMVDDKYLEVIEESPGKPTRYRFLMPTYDNLTQVIDATYDKSNAEPATNEDLHLLLPKEDKKTRRTRGVLTTAPDSFPIGGDLAKMTLAILRRDSISDQRDQFLDYHRAKGSRFADWTAAWRNWVKRAVKFDPTLAASALPEEQFGDRDNPLYALIEENRD